MLECDDDDEHDGRRQACLRPSWTLPVHFPLLARPQPPSRHGQYNTAHTALLRQRTLRATGLIGIESRWTWSPSSAEDTRRTLPPTITIWLCRPGKVSVHSSTALIALTSSPVHPLHLNRLQAPLPLFRYKGSGMAPPLFHFTGLLTHLYRSIHNLQVLQRFLIVRSQITEL